MRHVSWLVLVVMLVTSCAAPIQQVEYWQSEPRTQRVSNEYFDAELTPIFSSDLSYPEFYNLIYPGCAIFNFSLKNKSDKDIEIDWNKTLYISQGQTFGGFMFEGIAYLTRNNTKPPDIVFAHSSISKHIFPNRLVDFNRKWYHYPMNLGENGVYLSVIVDGKEITEKLIVNLSHEIITREMVKKEFEEAQKAKEAKEANEEALEKEKSVTHDENWYKGGNLHNKTALDWQKASYSNKLATCADFITKAVTSGMIKESLRTKLDTTKEKYIQELRPYAEELVDFIDATTEKENDPIENQKLFANQEVSEIAIMGMMMMDWMK